MRLRTFGRGAFARAHHLRKVWSHHTLRLRHGLKWAYGSREVTNFTYPITARNRLYMARLVSHVTGKPVTEIEGYFAELEENNELSNYVVKRLREGSWAWISDDRFNPGRRLGWYAIARAMKPKVIIESGCERGFGAICLVAALMKNGSGHYYGLDVHKDAGWLIDGPYSKWGTIILADALESLRAFDKPIDLYINDADHRLDFENAEYELIRSKLADGAVIVSDNAHATTALEAFARSTDRQFLFLADEPPFWIPGAGTGIAW